MKKILIFLSILLLLSVKAYALTPQYLCTTATTWAGANWVLLTASQAACTGGAVNTTTDQAVLNAASGSVTMGASTTTTGMDMTGYTHTLTLSSGQTLTVAAGNLATLAGDIEGTGNIATSTGGVTLASNITSSILPTLQFNGAETFTPTGFTWAGNVGTGASFGGFTVTLAGNAVIGGTLTLNDSQGAQMSFGGSFNLQTANYVVDQYSSGGTYSFTASQTLTVTNSMTVGVLTAIGTINSGTSSTSFNLKYTGLPSKAIVVNMNFTDTDASASSQAVWDYYGGTAPTLTRTKNINLSNASYFGGAIVL
jgi:hypothetical protein